MSPEQPPIRRRRKEREPIPQTLLVCAGESERRIDFLKWAFSEPNFTVTNRPGGVENESYGVIEIARKKIESVYKQILGENVIPFGGSLVVTAADIKTRIGISRVSRSKPETPEEIMRKLEWMSEIPAPYYTVDAGSGMKIGNDKTIKTHDQIVIILDPERIRQLATPEGFKKYRTDMQKYDAPPKGGKIDVTDISEGLSLPTLIASNAVLKIYRQEKNHKGEEADGLTFRQRVKQAIYFTGVGISPDLLRKIQPNIDRKIETWPWLEQVTTRCMREIAA